MTEFEVLLDRYRAVLERFIKYKISNRYDAEDLCQEVYLAAYQNFETLKKRELFKSWILGIAHHKCNDYFRRKVNSQYISLDELAEEALSVSENDVWSESVVSETISRLGEKDKQVLKLYFFDNLTQEEIARCLHIPVGTVKSRLYYAKKNFKENYPYPPRVKGEIVMKEMPEMIPNYQITKLNLEPFVLKHEELPGMMIIPKLGEKCVFALYDFPERKQSGVYKLKVIGNIVIHGVRGVEIESEYRENGTVEKRKIFAQLTDSYCRYLGGVYTDQNGTCHMETFLDESFEDSYGIGEDNCGFPTERRAQGLICEIEEGLQVDLQDDISDICGRFEVRIGGKIYDTVRILDFQPTESGVMLCEYYVDKTGHTILKRRFNKDDWAVERYQKKWTEILPENERMIVNGETYVHWYDCITEYVM